MGVLFGWVLSLILVRLQTSYPHEYLQRLQNQIPIIKLLILQPTFTITKTHTSSKTPLTPSYSNTASNASFILTPIKKWFSVVTILPPKSTIKCTWITCSCAKCRTGSQGVVTTPSVRAWRMLCSCLFLIRYRSTDEMLQQSQLLDLLLLNKL